MSQVQDSSQEQDKKASDKQSSQLQQAPLQRVTRNRVILGQPMSTRRQTLLVEKNLRGDESTQRERQSKIDITQNIYRKNYLTTYTQRLDRAAQGDDSQHHNAQVFSQRPKTNYIAQSIDINRKPQNLHVQGKSGVNLSKADSNKNTNSAKNEQLQDHKSHNCHDCCHQNHKHGHQTHPTVVHNHIIQSRQFDSSPRREQIQVQKFLDTPMKLKLTDQSRSPELRSESKTLYQQVIEPLDDDHLFQSSRFMEGTKQGQRALDYTPINLLSKSDHISKKQNFPYGMSHGHETFQHVNHFENPNVHYNGEHDVIAQVLQGNLQYVCSTSMLNLTNYTPYERDPRIYNNFESSPQSEILSTPLKKRQEKELRKSITKVSQIHPVKLSFNEFYPQTMVTHIYKGPIETLNPLPRTLRENFDSCSSIEHFKDTVIKLGREQDKQQFCPKVNHIFQSDVKSRSRSRIRSRLSGSKRRRPASMTKSLQERPQFTSQNKKKPIKLDLEQESINLKTQSPKQTILETQTTELTTVNDRQQSRQRKKTSIQASEQKLKQEILSQHPSNPKQKNASLPIRGSIKVVNAIQKTQQIFCTCPKGNCKKKYCVCLKAGVACTSKCHCTDCENDERPEAAQRRKEQVCKINQGNFSKGCNCKKNECRLNYCVCFASGRGCDPKYCSCVNCLNGKCELHALKPVIPV